MTLEEIINEAKNALRISTDYDPYAEGYQDALIWFCDMLDTIDYPYPWHLYPKEKPPKNGPYLVTWGNEYPIVAKFKEGSFCFGGVIAWAELPKLYKGEKNEKQST